MQEKVKNLLKEAMRAKEAEKLGVYRMLSAAFTNELVAQGRPPVEVLSEEDCLKVVKRLVKQRKDSISQFITGGREDLADAEKAELAVLEELLPAQMSEEEITKIAESKIAEMNADATKKGQVVGAVLKETGGNADGALVKAVVDKLLK
jgi:hypothetical protein